jgi:hypothetical protein
MAAVAFDPLEYAQQLEAAGMPRAQAEVVAKGLTAMFIHNFDALVTKDYLGTRFSEFEARIDLRFSEFEAKIDLRFVDLESRIDQRFVGIDQRFADLESRMKLRFADVESRMDLRFADMETRFARVNVMLGVILAALAIPVLQTVLLWVR